MRNGIEVNGIGETRYYKDGELHREDGPAVISEDGDVEYYIDGMRHREDGPAVITAEGFMEWWINDVRHRKGDPAVIWERDGSNDIYYIRGELLSEREFIKWKIRNFLE